MFAHSKGRNDVFCTLYKRKVFIIRKLSEHGAKNYTVMQTWNKRICHRNGHSNN